MTQWKRERERETSEEERNKTTEKRVYRDARKEVLKVNRIAATESYCRGGKSRRRRHWMRRAEAIYSIHGRANTNLRLDVQTAPSRLFLSPWLFPRLFLHLRPLLLFSPSPPLFPLFSLPPCASPFSILLSFRPSALLPHDRFSSPCHQRTPLVICHSDSQHTIHQATARVRVRVSKRNVFRISETGPVNFRLVEIRSTLNLVGNYYPIFGGTSARHARPVSSLFFFFYFFFFSSPSSSSSRTGSQFWYFDSRQPLLRHGGINLVSLDRYFPAPSRSTLFTTNGRFLFWKILLLADGCMMRVCSAWIGRPVVKTRVGRRGFKAKFQAERARSRKLVIGYFSDRHEYRESWKYF